MLRLKICLITSIFCVISLNAQKSINDYKYVIVPIQYDFQKGEDLYQINSLTEYLFNKAGFETYLSNAELPEELRKNRCLSLTAKLVDKSKMLSTELHFDLIDCNNNIIFSSIDGKSKEKDYKKSFHECIRESFEGIKALRYTYSEATDSPQDAVLISVVEEVVQSKEETSVVIEEESVDPAVAVAVIAASATAVNTVVSENVIVKEDVLQNVLYAQSIKNGFQLVDSTPKVLYVIQETTVKDVYVIKDNSGVVYKENGLWKIDFYRNGALISKELNIKFF
jgi:hypothetical protein